MYLERNRSELTTEAALRAENTELRERVAWLERAFRAPPEYGGAPLDLTPKQCRMLHILMERKVVTKEAMEVALWYDAEDARTQKCLDVFICKLRKNLRQSGVEIETIRAVGWRIADPMKERIRSFISTRSV